MICIYIYIHIHVPKPQPDEPKPKQRHLERDILLLHFLGVVFFEVSQVLTGGLKDSARFSRKAECFFFFCEIWKILI